MTDLDATAVVHQLLAAAGSRLYESRLTEFERLGDIGCDLLFAVRDRPSDVPIGARTAHPRDIAEDVWHAFVVAARRWPDRFLEHVLSNPALHDDIEILDALGEVDRPAARALLVAAVNQRRTGHAFGRRYAIGSLIRLADPQVPDLLVRLVKDRDSSVRFAAVTAAIEHGDARSLPALQHISEAVKTALGTREFALDAIEAIAVREGLTNLIPPSDQRRLVELRRPATRTAAITVQEVFVPSVGVHVTAGEEVTRLQVRRRIHHVKAPCDGVVVSIGVSPSREPPPIMFRISTSHTTLVPHVNSGQGRQSAGKRS
ncbi:HEAT repeat domain-containing protein [Micromonospora sp. IBHARD004]|uniref:HEAT repeat domain-containing protein n=1 Tax=Micromonospora sp. IBHARD004 TaxID=3457764 RepID=UPI0040587AD1